MAALKKIGDGTNFVMYEDDRGNKLVKLDKVRFSYVFVGTPAPDEDDAGKPAPKWRGVFMLPKATHVAAKDAVKSIITELMAKNEVKIPNTHWFLSNGDDKEDENMHGHWLVSASDGRIRPTVRNGRGELLLEIDTIDKMIYGGCWGNALVRPWYFDGKSKKSNKTLPKRIVAGLTGVQFWKDDTPFGSGRIDDTDAWGAVDEEGGDGMSSGSDDDGL
jgi:hypothetical protein